MKMEQDNLYSKPAEFRSVARNTVWNLVGFCTPMAVALAAIPILIKGLGTDRFGTLTLAWMLVGYFSIFDLGLGRALTKLIAEKMGREEWHSLPAVFWTAMLMMLVLGLLVGGSVGLLSPALAFRWLNIPDNLRQETLYAFFAIATGLPIVISTTGVIGVLEAHQRFSMINKIRVFTGTFTFVGPLCVLPFSRNLAAVVGILIAGRLAEWMIYFVLCLRTMPETRRRIRFDVRLIRPLLTFGGWMTVSNLTLPLMIHINRFIIGSLISVAAVAYYTTPSEVVIKLLVFPRALVSVLFPTIAAQFAVHRRETEELFGRSFKYLLATLYPMVVAVVALAPEGLNLWLGHEYMVHSTAVMRLLISGVYILGFAFIPYTFLQGIGRPDLSAILHLVELPVFLAAAWFMTRHWGIRGAAVAWIARATLELICMHLLSLRFLPHCRGSILQTLALLSGTLLTLAGISFIPPLLLRVLVSALCLGVFYLVVWLFLFNEKERGEARHWLRRLPFPTGP